MKERELNFVNSLNNRVRKRYYCDDSGEINSIPLEENDQVYVINNNQLYQIESINEEDQLSGDIINFGGRNNTKIEDLKININPVQAGSGDPHPAIYSAVSGDVISFDAPVAANLKNSKVSIEPVQDLHGYENPWPAGGGKNKLPNKTYQVTAGVVRLGTDVNETGYIHLTAGTYTVSASLNAAARFYIQGAQDTRNTPIGSSSTSPGGTFTIPDDNDYTVWLYNSNGISASDVIWFQLESGSTATSYAPYSNNCPISGWSAVNVWRTGKNLLNPAERTITTENIRYYYNNPIKLPAGTYTLSISEKVNGIYVNAEGVASIFTKYNTNFITFTLTGEYYIHFNFYKTGGINQNDTCQLELGSTATAYEPYSGNQYTIQLGQTVYGGTLDVTNGVLTVDRAMVDLGTIAFAKSSGQSAIGGSVFNVPLADVGNGMMPRERYTPNNVLSDTFITCNENTWWVNNMPDNSLLVGDTAFFVACSEYSDAVSFRTAMSGVQLVYELATPIIIPLTPTEISTLQGQQNNVWADSGDIEATYMTQSANIRPISGWSEVKVTRTGKNLLDLSSVRGGNFDTAANFPSSNASTNDYIPVKGGASYVWSQKRYPTNGGRYLRWYDKDHVQIGGSVTIYSQAAYTLTAPLNACYARFLWYQPSPVWQSKDDILADEPMFELGSIATAYEPYSGNTYTIQLGDTYYGGTLDVLGGVLTVDRAESKISDLQWSYISNWSYMNTQSLVNVIARPESNTTPLDGLLCSAYKTATAQQAGSGNINGTTAVDTTGGLRIKDNAYTDVATWLAIAGNETIVYPLATPIEIQLTPTQITTLLGTNNLWANTGEIKTLDVSTKGKNIFALAPPKT